MVSQKNSCPVVLYSTIFLALSIIALTCTLYLVEEKNILLRFLVCYLGEMWVMPLVLLTKAASPQNALGVLKCTTLSPN